MPWVYNERGIRRWEAPTYRKVKPAPKPKKPPKRVAAAPVRKRKITQIIEAERHGRISAATAAKRLQRLKLTPDEGEYGHAYTVKLSAQRDKTNLPRAILGRQSAKKREGLLGNIIGGSLAQAVVPGGTPLRDVDPKWLVGDAALLAGGLVTKPIAGAFRLGRAAGKASKAEKAAKPRKPPPKREFKDETGRVIGTTPAARSRTGRVIERAGDKLRPVAAKTRLVKTQAERGVYEAERTAKTRQKLEQVLRAGDEGHPGQLGMLDETFDATVAPKELGVSRLKQAVRWVNASGRGLILYSNFPAYVSANAIDNALLNVIQQGPFAAKNLRKAFRSNANLGKVETRAIDEVLDAGVAKAIGGEGKKRIARAAHYLADRPFRRASWLHEAARASYKSDDQIRELIHNASLFDDFDLITKRAVDAAIDFGRMSQKEKAFAEYVIFYPWVRGATRYTARFPLEHPIQALALGAAAYWGYGRKQEQLGEGPWYTNFLQKVGERGDLPIVMNPARLPFGTPYEVGMAAYGTVTGKEGLPTLAGNLSPVAELAGKALFGDPERPWEGRGLGNAVRNFGEGLAPFRIAKGLTMSDEDRKRKLFPRTKRDVLLQAAIGPYAPTPYNPEVAKKIARQGKKLTLDERVEKRQDEFALLEKKGLKLEDDDVQIIEKAFVAEATREMRYSDIAKETEPYSQEREMEKLHVVLDVLEEAGYLPAREAAQARAAYKRKPLNADAAAKDRKYYWDRYAGADLKWFRAEAKARGIRVSR